jgi:hypothetical protein
MLLPLSLLPLSLLLLLLVAYALQHRQSQGAVAEDVSCLYI